MWVGVLQAANIRLRGTHNDYIFRAEADDLLVDEENYLYQTPYFKFCHDHKVVPVINVVGKSEVRQSRLFLSSSVLQTSEIDFCLFYLLLFDSLML